MFRYIGKCCRCAITALIVCLAFVFNTSVFAQPVAAPDKFLYVDVDSQDQTPDGTTWASAFQDLQDGLAAAALYLSNNLGNDAHIWVAEGTYTPGTNRSDTFLLLDRCYIAGGFEGNEEEDTIIPGFYARRPLVNLTYLSGEISGDNIYHIVTAVDSADTAILDGFNIVHGNAVGAPAPSPNPGSVSAGSGGGMLITHVDVSEIPASIPRVLRCVFEDNTATYGGAVASASGGQASTPFFFNCVFKDNSATNGAGIYVVGTTVQCDPEPEGPTAFNGGPLCVNSLFVKQ